MTNLIRIIDDPGEADRANYDAHEEFVTALDQHDRGHLVTDAAHRRWYGVKEIDEDYGPPVTTRLVRP